MQIQTIKDVTFIGRTLRFVLFCLRVVNMSILDVVRRKRALTFLRVRPKEASGSCSIQQSSCYTCYTEDSCRRAIIDSCHPVSVYTTSALSALSAGN